MAGIYIHIPFCVKKCAYCDFVSIPETGLMGAYLDALEKEICLSALEYPVPETVDTVFFGGGTPSLLEGEQIGKILSILKRHYPVSSTAEISMEANPGTMTPRKADAFLKAGVNRLSIGVQSLEDGLLKTIGRIHSAEQFFRTYECVTGAGFSNINCDCMHGLPGQSQEQYLSTLQDICALPSVTHVSSYSLILEEGTPLHSMVKKGSVTLPDEEAVADMQDAGIKLLERNGFIRYEISNFAKEGFRCRHNLNYWHNGEYLGFGCAAHSAVKDRGGWTRHNNLDGVRNYIAALCEDRLPVDGMESIPLREEMFETVMLGLRLMEGVDLASFRMRFGEGFADVYPIQSARLVEEGLAENDGNRFHLTNRGLDIENEILLRFMD